MSLKFAAGDLTIHRIIEQETTFLPALEVLPGLTPDVLAENRAWMQKAGALDANDVLILAFQSYIVKTPHHTILIDSCIGNDKPRPLRPKWNMKTDDTYARALAAAGFAVGDIDYGGDPGLREASRRPADGRAWVPFYWSALAGTRRSNSNRSISAASAGRALARSAGFAGGAGVTATPANARSAAPRAAASSRTRSVQRSRSSG